MVKLLILGIGFNCLRVVSQFGAPALQVNPLEATKTQRLKTAWKLVCYRKCDGQVRKASFQHSRSTRGRGAESYSTKLEAPSCRCIWASSTWANGAKSGISQSWYYCNFSSSSSLQSLSFMTLRVSFIMTLPIPGGF